MTTILIIITVIASLYSWQKPEIHRKWILNPYAIRQHNQYYRFVTSGFIHNDYGHLIFNMLTLYFFGGNVEYIFKTLFGEGGIFIYLVLYIGGIVVSDLPTFFKHKDDPYYNALGASGGVASIIFCSILFFPLDDICLYGVLCVPGFMLGAIYLVYSAYQSNQARDNINHDAHFYGAAFGLVFTIIIKPNIIFHFFEQISSFSF